MKLQKGKAPAPDQKKAEYINAGDSKEIRNQLVEMIKNEAASCMMANLFP